MAQSDSQRAEFEEPDSSDLDSVVPSDDDGEGFEPALGDGSESIDYQAVSEEMFDGEIDDMLGSIDINSDSLVDEFDAEDADSEVSEQDAVDEQLVDELAAADIRNEVSGAFAEEEVEEILDEMEYSLPTAEDLLAQAGSILNGADFKLPVEEIAEPREIEGDALMAMPDPQALMNPDSDNPGEVTDLPKMNAASNIADRAGDLPPPPPVPVCLDDGEIYVEDEFVQAEPPKEKAAADEQNLPSEDTETNELSVSEGVSGDVSFLMEDDDLMAAGSSFDGFNVGSDGEEPLEARSASFLGIGSHSASVSKRGIFGRTLQSTTLAAGLLFVGLGITLAFVKDELYEYLKGSSLEEATISWHVATIAKQVFEELEDTRYYHVNDFKTEIRQTSDTEVLIEVKMEAHLTTDLYLPVEDTLVYSQIEFAPRDLETAASFVSKVYPKESLTPPEQPWKNLYRLSSHKGESFPLNANFRLTRDSARKAWSFSNLHVKADGSSLIWGKGEVVDLDEDTSMEVSSQEFQYRLRTYKLAAQSYLEKVKVLEAQFVTEEIKRERERVERRNHLATSLSKGSFFQGMAIAGKDGADAREISLIITETRNEGAMIKGVLKLDSNHKHSKHFTGILDIVEKEDGNPQALLSLTTVAFENQPAGEAPAFFKPGTVSRFALKTDGYRMEGDGEEISLRLIRSM